MMRRNGKEGSSYVPRVEITVWKEEKTREEESPRKKRYKTVEDKRKIKEHWSR